MEPPISFDASAVRSESAMMVSAGLAASELGKVELSAIQRLGIWCERPYGSTTEASGSAPMRQVPMVCAVRGSTQMSRAPAASQAWIISFTACKAIRSSLRW